MTALVDSMRAAIATDAERLAALVESDGAVAVPTCPGWDVARLAGHTARVYRMAISVLTNSLQGFPDPDSLEKPPRESDAVPDYVRRGAAELDAILAGRDPGSEAWNFLNEPKRAYFWFRRQAHETAVHRWDAENAVGSTWHVPAELAVDGVDEYFVMVRERLLAARGMASLGGSLHLHATDTPGEWMINVDDGVIAVSHAHGKGDAALRGTASDLFLGLWGRRDLVDDERFQRFGSPEVIAAIGTLGGT